MLIKRKINCYQTKNARLLLHKFYKYMPVKKATKPVKKTAAKKTAAMPAKKSCGCGSKKK
jgi:hypothetical protein